METGDFFFPHLLPAWRVVWRGAQVGFHSGSGILILSVWTNQSGSCDGALCAIFSSPLPKQSASLLVPPCLDSTCL